MIYQFDEFTIDTESFEITKVGEAIGCEPKVFDLIVYLVKNHHRVVSRDELFESVWKGAEVSDTSLSNHIKFARKLFGDDGQKQKVIKTIHGRGYQFIGSLVNTELSQKPTQENYYKNNPEKPPLSNSLLKYIFVGIAILSLIFLGYFYTTHQHDNEKESYLIGVLPLINTKPNEATDYYGLAIADRIISELAYQKNINVRASTSIRKYVNTFVDPKEVGQDLNVDYVLTGNYLKINDLIRLNIELVEVKTNHLIWRSKQIEVAYNNAFQLQDIVAKKVLNGLHLKLIQPDKAIATQSVNPEAFNLYLKSIALPFTTEGHKQAIKLLKQSLELENQYAPTYVQLGNRIRRLEQFGLVNTGESHDTLKYYQKALSIDPSLLSAMSHLAFVYTETNRINEAMELVLRMIEINPNNAQTRFTLGYILRYAGHTEKALLEMEKAVSLDPKNVRFRTLVSTYSGLAKFDSALSQLEHYEESPFTIGWQGLIDLRLGNKNKAIENFDRLIDSDTSGLWGLVSKIHRSYLLNEFEVGLTAVHQLEQTNILDSETIYYIAVYYCMLEDNKRCLNAYRRAVEGGYYNYPYIDNSPYWENVKTEPEFLALYQKAQQKSHAFGLEYLSNISLK